MTACESPAVAEPAGSRPAPDVLGQTGAEEEPSEAGGKEPQAAPAAAAELAEGSLADARLPAAPVDGSKPSPDETKPAATAADVASAPAAEAPREEAIAEGKDVEVVGTSMNGSVGVALEYVEAKARWKVRFASGVSKNFKLENLQVAKAAAVQTRTSHHRLQLEGEAGARQRPVEGRGGLQVGGSVSDLLDRMRRESAFTTDEVAVATPTPAAPPPATDATSAEAAAAGPGAAKPADVARGQGPPSTVNLAGRPFADKDELIKHVREMQKRLEEKGGDGILEAEDRFLLFHMAMQHPRTSEKMKAPVNAIRYGVHHSFPQSKCFILVFADGTEEPVSWMKCVKELYSLGPARNKKRGRDADDEGKPTKKRPRNASLEPRHVQTFTEQSRAETGLQLLRDVAAEQRHPLAARWEYPLMDEARRCFAGYMQCPLEPDAAKAFYDRAASGTTWGQPVDPRSGEPIPRKTAWMVSSGCTCTYRYGGVDVDPQEFPPWMIDIMQVYMPICGLSSREEWPNSCNLNLYEDAGMSVGWHADNEKLFQGRYRDIRIISVSLGQARTFELREMGIDDDADSRIKYKLRLGDGDVCTMEGLTQKHYQHRVPKEESSGPRINLTWRWVRRHRPECPACPPRARDIVSKPVESSGGGGEDHEDPPAAEPV